jgi:hypothetical protein
LGATASRVKKIYDVEAAIQRPIYVEEKDASISVNDDNWVQYLGNQRCAGRLRVVRVYVISPGFRRDSAYGSFFKFFSRKVADLGAGPALEKFVFNATANTAGKVMLIRLMSGAYVVAPSRPQG